MDNQEPALKNRGTYILLAIFLGVFGMHNIYAGRTWVGFIQFLLTTTGIGASLSLSWAIVEIFTVKEDAWGRKFL